MKFLTAGATCVPIGRFVMEICTEDRELKIYCSTNSYDRFKLFVFCTDDAEASSFALWLENALFSRFLTNPTATVFSLEEQYGLFQSSVREKTFN